MIPAQTVARILEEAQIDNVVGEYVTLKKRGANLIGLCPFHNEKTPSFVVSPAKGIYKCFGCGAAGNVTKFLMEHEHVTYPEALRSLAARYSIEIADKPRTAQEEAAATENEAMGIANSFAHRFFENNLRNSDEGRSVGLTYLKERGFSEAVLSKFELGYALDAPSAFVDRALEKGYQLEILRKAGLVASREDKKLDFFRGRVIFPIHNLTGRVVAFAGRTLRTDGRTPKYVNSPESELYHKSRVLYGMHLAKNRIRQEDNCYMVEGYTDVMSLFQAGVENVVASSGTSLTEDQVRLVKRFSKNVTLLYDSDAAGAAAARRGTSLLLQQDMNAWMLILPEGQDPDSFIRSTGANGFAEYVQEHRKDFILFMVDRFLQSTDQDPIRKAELVREIVDLIARIPDPLKRSLYQKDCSQRLGIDEQIFIVETNKTRRQRIQKEEKGVKQDVKIREFEELKKEKRYEGKPELYFDMLERDLIRLIMDYGTLDLEEGVPVARYILEELETVEIENPLYRKVDELIHQRLTAGSIPEPAFYINHEDEEVSGLAVELLSSAYEASPNWHTRFDIWIPDIRENFRKDVQSSLTRFKLYKVQRMIDENHRKLRDNKDDSEQVMLMKTHQHLHAMKQELSGILGTVVTK